MVVVGKRIWCLGGVSGDGYRDEVEIYDTAADRWMPGPPLPRAKAWVGACLLDGKIHVAGGADSHEGRYRWLSEFHALDLAANGRR